MKNNWRLWLGASFLALLAVISIAGPYLPFVDQNLKPNLSIMTETGSFVLPPFPPMEGFPLGSDHNGRDILSLLILGAGETLLIVLSVAAVRYLFAIPLAIAGFYSRFFEGILNGWQHLFSFMPPIFFVAFFSGLPFIFFSDFRPIWMVLVLALLETGRVAEIIHTHMRETEKKPYIEAGIVAGCTRWKMFKSYYLPVVTPNIIILILNDMARVLFLIGQLGIIFIFINQEFMSLESGAYEPVNTSHAWPTLFSSILKDVRIYKWIPFSAMGAIGITILSLNVFASGLQHYFEKKFRLARNDL